MDKTQIRKINYIINCRNTKNKGIFITSKGRTITSYLPDGSLERLEFAAGLPSFGSSLCFSGFSLCSSFDSKHGKQPIFPNQSTTPLILSLCFSNSLSKRNKLKKKIQSKLNSSYFNSNFDYRPRYSYPKFWMFTSTRTKRESEDTKGQSK